MKIVIAPDSFKEALDAPAVAQAIAQGARAVYPHAEIIERPMADGGEGTMAILVQALGGETRTCEVNGPLDDRVQAHYGLIDDGNTAVIEMAQAAGLQLIPPDRRDPTRTTTRGVGELIRDALDQQVKKIILGIGDSATVDGGCGMASALGVSLLDFENGSAGLCGGDVGNIIQIDLNGLDPRIKKTEIIVASDVTNPLLGANGAARIYGPQKGATPEQVKQLELNLETVCGLLELVIGRDLRDLPGAGAAGGLGMGLIGFLGAQIKPGFEIVANAVRLSQILEGADWVITGEGAVDSQSVAGKVVAGVGRIAQQQDVATVALTGHLSGPANALIPFGIEQIIQITPAGLSGPPALEATADNLTQATHDFLKMKKSG